MVIVCLVVNRSLLWLELRRYLVEHSRKEPLLGFLVCGIAVPDGDEVGVETRGKGEAA